MQNVILKKPRLVNIQRKSNKKEFSWVYQVLILYPGDFNYVTISSSLSKDVSLTLLKEIRKHKFKAKIEVVNRHDHVIDSF